MKTKVSETSEKNVLGIDNKNYSKNEEKVNVKYEPIKDTPFTTVSEENEHFIVLGNYQITEKYKTKKAAQEQVKLDNWLFVTNVISVMIDQILEIRK